MILFLNFAPLSFGGGAERWMLDVSSELSADEEVALLDTRPSVSNWYGKFVLKQPYSNRVRIDRSNHFSIGVMSLIPFTKQWRSIKKLIDDARLIYIRYELLESIIVLYFGGFSLLKKTVAGTHSPIIYRNPVSFKDTLHNLVYRHIVNPVILKSVKKIHVLNRKDKDYLSSELQNTQIIHIPNYIKSNGAKTNPLTKHSRKLHIAFAGVLNRRKGADILLKIINSSPHGYVFHIAGEGPFAKELESAGRSGNVKYYGFLPFNKLKKLYGMCDVLLLPSRAEAFSLVCLEAMSQGLPVINSPETNLGLPGYAQVINKKGTIDGYLKILNEFYKDKLNGKIEAQQFKVRNFTESKFSDKIILPQIRKKLFNIT